jgi:hypothetical protein
MALEIVKVQLPLSDPTHPALVYARGRRHLTQQRLEPSARAAMGLHFKAFFEAEYHDGAWILGERVTDRDW